MRIHMSRVMRTSSVFAVIACALGTPALAKTYYVSGTGDDNNDGLTRSTAFRTLQTAANLTKPGDTVSVLNGVYTDNGKGENILWVHLSGTASKPIIFTAATGEKPVIKVSTNPKVQFPVYIGASYITLSGFEVIGRARSVTLAHAKAVAKQEEAAYQKSVAAHNKNPSVPIVYPSDAETNHSCIFIDHAAHVTILNNLVHDCSAAGINSETSDYIRIESNVVYNTSWWTVYDTTGIDVHGMLNSDNSAGYKNFVLNNISHDNANTQPFYNFSVGNGIPTDGNGIIIDSNQQTSDGKPYLGKTLVMGNIVYNNGGTGMHAFRSHNVDFFNNTAFRNNVCPIKGSNCGDIKGGQIVANTSVNVNIYNNILYAPASRYVYKDFQNTNVSEDYNIFYNSGGTVMLGNYKPSKHDILKNPDFYDATTLTSSSVSAHIDNYDRTHPLQAITDLGLKANSVGLNAGTMRLDNGTAFSPVAINGNQDPKIDIGAISGVTK